MNETQFYEWVEDRKKATLNEWRNGKNIFCITQALQTVTNLYKFEA
jgi:hypothetical protein